MLRGDYTVYRPSESVWYSFISSDATVKIDRFGAAEDIALNGDFNGDGRADLAVFPPSEGSWYIARPVGIPAKDFDVVRFGLSSDKLVPADYDGDGKTDIAVWRVGVYYIINSSTCTISYQYFGQSGDTPIESSFMP